MLCVLSSLVHRNILNKFYLHRDSGDKQLSFAALYSPHHTQSEICHSPKSFFFSSSSIFLLVVDTGYACVVLWAVSIANGQSISSWMFCASNIVCGVLTVNCYIFPKSYACCRFYDVTLCHSIKNNNLHTYVCVCVLVVRWWNGTSRHPPVHTMCSRESRR